MAAEAVASLLASMRAMLDFYNTSFGASDPQREITGVFRPHPGVEGQGGYFRKGYFVFPKTDNVQNLVVPIAHELAHHWWLKAGRQHAWLNESFAEYSALLFVRQKRRRSFSEVARRQAKPKREPAAHLRLRSDKESASSARSFLPQGTS